MRLSNWTEALPRMMLYISLLMFAAAVAGFAQAGRGGISGLVTDTSGAVISGVTVQALELANGAVFQTVTTHTAMYSFVSLAPSANQVTVSHPGFETAVHTNVIAPSIRRRW
jgi:Carboxypeptidase regulatory-like domain